MNSNNEIAFLQWALPQMGYRWDGFRKPRNQVIKRIRERIHELELSGGFNAYRNYLEEHPDEWDHLDRLCDVTISKFFRDRKVWEYLRDRVLAEMITSKKPKPVNTWSVGCCNGEEPYTVAIIVEQLKQSLDIELQPGNLVSILASDRNEQVLARAQAGKYPGGALKELSEQEIGIYFHKTDADNGETYEIDERFRQPVTFESRDIQESFPDVQFDLVLCRNLVFTYFSKERQHEFLNRLEGHMNRAGFLVIGSNEQLPVVNWLRVVSKTHRIYSKNSH